jgi:hypothetical protein
LSERVQQTVSLLLKQPGVDAHAASATGDTPLNIARRCHQHIMELFDFL